MAKLQLNGNLTITNSKILTPEEKAKVMAASEGKARALRLTLLDAQGHEVVLEGRLYESKAGSLTARFNTKVENFEIVEVEAKQDRQAQSDEERQQAAAQALATELGL